LQFEIWIFANGAQPAMWHVSKEGRGAKIGSGFPISEVINDEMSFLSDFLQQNAHPKALNFDFCIQFQ
jgi:hypothetical protein